MLKRIKINEDPTEMVKNHSMNLPSQISSKESNIIVDKEILDCDLIIPKEHNKEVFSCTLPIKKTSDEVITEKALNYNDSAIEDMLYGKVISEELSFKEISEITYAVKEIQATRENFMVFH